jgi:hypothetical protein
MVFVFRGNVGDYLKGFGTDLRPIHPPEPIFRRRPKIHAKPRKPRRGRRWAR